MDIEKFVSQLKKVKHQGNGYIACCPAHDDKIPSLSIQRGEKGKILLHCFAGCSNTSILQYMGLQENDLFPDNKISNTNVKKLVNHYIYKNELGEPLFEVCRYDPKDFKIRRFENGKTLWGLGDIEPVLYNLPMLKDALINGSNIFICEGEKDTDTLVSLRYTATTAPMGAGKWIQRYTESLKGAKRVIIIPDCDIAGRQHALLIADNLLKENILVKIADLQFCMPSLPEKSDITDFLNKNGTMDNILENLCTAEEFRIRYSLNMCERSHSTMQEFLQNTFWDIFSEQSKNKKLTTGFPSLDSLLGNTLAPGLYVLGAISSLGKSAFCSQICDTIAKQRKHVLYFSLEMSSFEMVSRTITRFIFEKNPTYGKPIVTGNILRGEVSKTLIETIIEEDLSVISSYITYIEGNFKLGVAEICRYCEEFIAKTKEIPIICVDYLQVLTPPEPRLTDKQTMDANVIALKRMSIDLKIPILAISSLNRQSYNDELSFSSFKESGAIEYSADLVMGLQASGISDIVINSHGEEKKLYRQVSHKVKAVKRQYPRELEVVILKNRRGESTGQFNLKYWPGQNYFEEG